MCCKSIKRLCLKIFPEEEKPTTHNVYEISEDDDEAFPGYDRASIRPNTATVKPNRMSIKATRSVSSVPSRDKNEKKHRSNSIFGERSTIIKREENEKRRAKKSLIPNATITKKNVFDDPVTDHWANKGTTIYTALDHLPPEKSTKYWVQTELQYVILLPTQRRKLKSKERPPQGSVTSLPSQLDHETFQTSTPRRSLPSNTRQSVSSNPRQSLPASKLSQTLKQSTSTQRKPNSSSSSPSSVAQPRNKSSVGSEKKKVASSSGSDSSKDGIVPSKIRVKHFSPSDTRQTLSSNPKQSLPASKLSQTPKQSTSTQRKPNSSSSSSSSVAQPRNKSSAGSKKKKVASSSSDSSKEKFGTGFQPRAAAKPAPKPKGRFCCAKRQDSG